MYTAHGATAHEERRRKGSSRKGDHAHLPGDHRLDDLLSWLEVHSHRRGSVGASRHRRHRLVATVKEAMEKVPKVGLSQILSRRSLVYSGGASILFRVLTMYAQCIYSIY